MIKLKHDEQADHQHQGLAQALAGAQTNLLNQTRESSPGGPLALCPDSLARWYCLNGATCFGVLVEDSLLYSCWCRAGFHGARCDYKYASHAATLASDGSQSDASVQTLDSDSNDDIQGAGRGAEASADQRATLGLSPGGGGNFAHNAPRAGPSAASQLGGHSEPSPAAVTLAYCGLLGLVLLLGLCLLLVVQRFFRKQSPKQEQSPPPPQPTDRVVQAPSQSRAAALEHDRARDWGRAQGHQVVEVQIHDSGYDRGHANSRPPPLPANHCWARPEGRAAGALADSMFQLSAARPPPARVMPALGNQQVASIKRTSERRTALPSPSQRQQQPAQV